MFAAPELLRAKLRCIGNLTHDQAQANEPLKESEFLGEDGFLEENELLLEENDTLEDEASEALERGENVDRQ